MLRKLIVTVLMLILTAPINAVASASMAISIAAYHDAMPTQQLVHGSHASHDAAIASQNKTKSAAHDHSDEDCDDYCMSCSNHCSSSAIVTSSKHDFELEREFEDLASAHTLSRAYLLFRPPIRA